MAFTPPTIKLESYLQPITYEKISQTFNAQMGLTDVWRDIDFYQEKRFHPTQKPLKLIKRLLQASSNENDLVLDPFGGSGVTALASIALKRDFIIIELDEPYYQIISERVQEMLMPNDLFKVVGMV